MKFSVEMTITEAGTPVEKYGYLRDSEIELRDLLKWGKEQLILVADTVLKEEQANGFDKDPVLLVDGRRNKDVNTVSPLGQIEFVAQQDFGEVLLEAYTELLRRSKVRTGTYIDSHYIFLNGVQVANDYSRLQRWISTEPTIKSGDIIRIVNIQPYARRLETLGVTAQRQQSRRQESRRSKRKAGVKLKIPNGAYQLTYRAISAKYKSNVKISFSFLPGNALGLTGSFKGRGLKKNSAGRPYLYPALSFTISDKGLL